MYHIGMPLVSNSTLVQLSLPSDRELKILNLNLLVDALKRDPSLVHIPEPHIPTTMQTLFVATGCDYTSFFAGIGKAFFMKIIFEYATFIIDNQVSTFACSISHNNLRDKAEVSQLAFFRLVGCAYFKKHSNAFYGSTPSSLFHSFVTPNSSPLEQHCKWLNHLRETIWDRITFESETIPSLEALQYHWLRNCWVIHMWQQADSNRVVLTPLHNNGWVWEGGKIAITWDTPENRRKVRQRVDLLMQGCGCKSGCGSNRCSGKKKGSVWCRCVNCMNTVSAHEEDQEDQEDAVIRMERYII